MAKKIIVPNCDVVSLNDTTVVAEEYRGYRDTEYAYHLGPGFSSGPVWERTERPAEVGDVTRYLSNLYEFDGKEWRQIE